MSAQDQYASPLAERYASKPMLELWSPRLRYGLWRRLWLALAEAQRELGLNIPAQAIEQMRAHQDDIDFDVVAAYERRFRHDVMAHIHAFGDVAPAAKPFIHLGATSAYVTDNADLIVMRRALGLLKGKSLRVLRALAKFARRWRDEPTLGSTHLQPAQPTTVGKRATLWMQDLVLDIRELDHRVNALPCRGVKGTTGTQASFLELFDGDHDKVRELERKVSAAIGFSSAIPVSGQTYTRKLDAQVLDVVAGLAASAAKFSGDLRILQAFGEIEEPFEPSQVGSSAMAYKRNPMRCERIASLARFVLTLEPNANETHAVQFLERTLDDSANRRLSIPESFLATDAILVLMENVVSGLDVHPARIRRRLEEELPFMATEQLLIRAVRAGGDRQEAHERLRTHSIEAARALKEGAPRNDLLDRLAGDKEWKVPLRDMREALEPSAFVGRASQQVDEFLHEIAEPLLEGTDAEEAEEVRV
ncbi:MAG: adenylosuccinate lyase [Gemmatimonadaceae bacterium]